MALLVGLVVFVALAVGTVFVGYWVGASFEENKQEQNDLQANDANASPSESPQGSSSNFIPTGTNTGTGGGGNDQSPVAPVQAPVTSPTQAPVTAPTEATSNDSDSTTEAPSQIKATYVPGDLTRNEEGLLLSTGLRARVIAKTGEPVSLFLGGASDIPFHGRPDFGATFSDPRPFNEGGWVYASNSEMNVTGTGGVGSILFDRFGNVLEYKMVLEGTTMNCGGGRTPWYVREVLEQ